MVEFDVARLNKSEKSAYEAMNEKEKESYERLWIQMESTKVKMLQHMHASKERSIREKRIQAEKERKERTHRLIERGAILESLMENAQDLTNEEIKDFLKKTITTDYAVSILQGIRKMDDTSGTKPQTFF